MADTTQGSVPTTIGAFRYKFDDGLVVAQVVSDDEGRVEVFDLQYYLFTLVALTFFAFAFLTEDFDSAPGLPDLPLELVALTGVSAATYVARKGIENEEPVLTGAIPETVFSGETVRIRGRNLAFEIPGAEPVKPETVLFGGGRRIRSPTRAYP